ncbi:unnamed protein product [Strongylus vulgaris]|uniref:Nucleolar protein 6 n=1 Tax=Strongylus vulgaris TaxID=40348 RepID=A0A3P7IMK9_STRVU|nr:unnamed protein product [Strongylus vulgaris]
MKRTHPGDDVEVQTVVKPMSNVFQLQCEDAERERHAAPEVVAKWEELAKKVALTLRTAKSKHSCQYKDLDSWKKYGITHPFNELADAVARSTSSVTEYKWASPEEVIVLSDSAIDLIGSSFFIMRIFVTLPDSLFGKRDYINLTYPTKRAHYMCGALLALRKAYKDYEISFMPGLGRDAIFPVLKVTDKTSTGCVLIHFGASESVLAKTSRFAPNISNLRPSAVYPHITDKDEEATPEFNQRILRTILEPAIIRRVSAELRHKEHIVSALALAARFFKCRDLPEFDDLFLACFFVRLLETNVVAKQQDVLTMLRNVFSAIANWNTTTAMGFHPDDLEEDVIAAHIASFPIVFLDSTGYWNIAAVISEDSLLLVCFRFSSLL